MVPGYFEIDPSTGAKYQRAMHITLVDPNVLTYTDSVTVTIKFALDTTIAQSDNHDPIFGISDKNNFLGFKPSMFQTFQITHHATVWKVL